MQVGQECPPRPPRLSRRGVVLVAVLVVVVLLSLAAYQYTDLMTAEYKATDNAVRYAQARGAAEAGIHYTAALLADPTNMNTLLHGSPWENAQVFQGQLVRSENSPRYTARFSIVSPRDDDSTGAQGPRFGVADEAGKININALMILDPSGNTLYTLLMQLPNMTSDIANAIIDWLDPDDTVRTSNDGGVGGAESDYYLSLNPPYRCKNAPIDSLEELLWVRGVTPQLLFGNDTNRNGVQDADETSTDGTFDRGWSAYLTIYSREQNVDSTGNPRIYLNDSDLDTLYNNLSSALGDDLAKFIVLVRTYGLSTNGPSASGGGAAAGNTSNKSTGSTPPASGNTTNKPTGTTPPAGGSTNKSAGTPATGGSGGSTSNTNSTMGTLSSVNRTSLNLPKTKSSTNISSLYDLINAYVEIPAADANSKSTLYPSPLSNAGNLRNMLPLLLDKTTVTKEQEILGRINVNTAPQAVLAALPGLSDTDVQMIMTLRPATTSTDSPDPIFSTPAWLITEANIQPAVMQKLDKYITTTTQVYRFQVLGYFDGGGPVVRMEAVVDTNNGQPRILYQRDISELGKGFDVQNQQ
jgi:type II secretory pathway component PulK